MGEVVRLTRKRAIKVAKRRIRRLWEEGNVVFTDHVTKKLGQRNLDANDIQHVIRYGRLTKGGTSEWPSTPRRFVLVGKAVDGGKLTCVVEANGVLVIITAIPSAKE